jgi:hypothetical protein
VKIKILAKAVILVVKTISLIVKQTFVAIYINKINDVKYRRGVNNLF